MTSKVDQVHNNKIEKQTMITEPLVNVKEEYNPIEYNANVQHEFWIQKEVSFF